MLEPHGVRFNNPADQASSALRRLVAEIAQREQASPAIDWRIMPSVVSELSRMDEAAAACVILMIATLHARQNCASNQVVQHRS